jgi:hypothetical protein
LTPFTEKRAQSTPWFFFACICKSIIFGLDGLQDSHKIDDINGVVNVACKLGIVQACELLVIAASLEGHFGDQAAHFCLGGHLFVVQTNNGLSNTK